MLRSRVRHAAAFVLLLVVPTAAHARQTAGTVRISVIQRADATSEVTATAVDEPSRRSLVQARGAAWVEIAGLPPAMYRVSVTFGGGSTIGIDLLIGDSEVVAIVADPAAGGADGHLLVVDRRQPGFATDFDERQIQALPTGSELSAMLDTAAPYVVVDTIAMGGLNMGDAALVGARSTSATQTALTVDGFPIVRAPATSSQPAWYPRLEAIQAVSVAPLLADAHISGSGANIALRSRRPSQTRQGSFNYSFTTPRMVSTNARDGIPSVARLSSWRSGALQLSTPVASRARLFLSASHSAMQRRERDTPTPVDADATSLFGHLTANLGQHTQVRWLATAERAHRPYGRVQQYRHAGIDERDWFVHSQAGWQDHLGSGARFELAGAYQRGALTPTGGLAPGTVVDRASDGLVPAPVADVGVTQFDLRFSVDAPTMRRHTLRFGVTLARSASTIQTIAAPAIAELVYGLPARIWVPTISSAASHRAVNRQTFVASDHFSAARNLSVDLGLQTGRTSGAAKGAEQDIVWHALLPRASVRWAPAPITLFGGYARYQADMSLDVLAHGDPGESVTAVYRWTDVNTNGRFDPGEAAALIARAGRGPAVATVDASLRAPYTDEFVIGAERRLGSSMRVRAVRVHRRERDLVRSVNVGVPASSYHSLFIPDIGEKEGDPDDDRLLEIHDRLPSSFGQDRYLLTNPAEGDSSYDATEVTWELMGRRWWSMVGASSYVTWAHGGNRGFRPDENDQGVIGELLENLNAQSYSRGASFFDRQYVLKVSTGFRVRHDWLVSVVGRYQDGQPFSRLVVAADLAQGPELVNAYRAGRTRFTFTSTLDARIERGLTFGKRRAALRMDVLNLTNLGNEVEEDAISGPNFRQTTAVQPPRAIRLGFQFDF